MEMQIKNINAENITTLKNVLINPSIEIVTEQILKNGEGNIGMKGAMMVDTGVFTGRSPKDKYFVEEDSSKDNLWWGPVNKKVKKHVFDFFYVRFFYVRFLF